MSHFWNRSLRPDSDLSVLTQISPSWHRSLRSDSDISVGWISTRSDSDINSCWLNISDIKQKSQFWLFKYLIFVSDLTVYSQRDHFRLRPLISDWDPYYIQLRSLCLRSLSFDCLELSVLHHMKVSVQTQVSRFWFRFIMFCLGYYTLTSTNKIWKNTFFTRGSFLKKKKMDFYRTQKSFH